MEKKIIAVALILVLIATAFVGCKKGEIYVDDDGYEHLLVTDKEGNTVLDENGNIKTYITEADGSIKKDEDGKKLEGIVAFPDLLVKDNVVETPYYKIVYPEEEWVIVNRTGRACRNNSIDSSLNVTILDNLPKETTLDSYYEEQKITAEKIHEQNIAVNTKSELICEKISLTSANCDTRKIEYKVINPEGKVIYYSINLYVMSGDTILSIRYASTGEYYESDLDIVAFLNESLTIK